MQYSRVSLINVYELEHSLDVDLSQIMSAILKYVNLFYPYAYFIISSTFNLLMVVTILTPQKKSVHVWPMMKSLQIRRSIVFQISILAFTLANIRLNSSVSSRTLIHYSVYACKLLSFIIHITSTASQWGFAICLFVIRCYISKDKQSLKRVIQIGVPIFILLLTFVYSLDLIFLDLNPLTNVNNNETAILYCSIEDKRVLLIRDGLDFLVFFVMPFTNLYFHAYRLRPMLRYYPTMKCLFQIIFIFFFLPNMLVTTVHNVNIYFEKDEKEKASLWLDMLFTLTLILSNSSFLIIVLLNAYFNTHTRHILYKFFCFPCFVIKKINNLERDFAGEERSFFSENNISVERY